MHRLRSVVVRVDIDTGEVGNDLERLSEEAGK
jgi:hypothetical protein